MDSCETLLGKISEEMARRSESWEDVFALTLTTDECRKPWHDGRIEPVPFYVWTARFVYFLVDAGTPEDGTYCSIWSVPRVWTDAKPEFVEV